MMNARLIRTPYLLKFKGKEEVTEPAHEDPMGYFSMLFDDEQLSYKNCPQKRQSSFIIRRV